MIGRMDTASRRRRPTQASNDAAGFNLGRSVGRRAIQTPRQGLASDGQGDRPHRR
jgi:hypothetical protein